jgi:ABC-type polysaccharide/polyol phosphate export permease
MTSFTIFFDRYYWQTVLMIARNSLARQYRNSFLGLLWTLLQPFCMVIIYTLIMPLIMRAITPNYVLYIIVALPMWNFFSAALISSANSIIANGETLKRCIISSTVFPLAEVGRHAYTLFVSFVTMYVVALLLGVVSFSPLIFLVPLYFIPILITIGALAVAIAFIAPYVRDIGEFVYMAINMLFWLTPVVYQISVLPANIQSFMEWNPFFIMIHPIQMLACNHIMPSMGETLQLIAVAIIAIAVGSSFFKICHRNYVYYI